MERFIDISRHQQRFDGAKAKERVSGIFARAAYARSQDSLFDSIAKECKQNGLSFGAYQFCTWHYKQNNFGNVATAESLMVDQTNRLIEILNNYEITSWVAIDQEVESGKTMGLDYSSNTRLLNRAIRMLKSAGYSPCVYASASWFNSHICVSDLEAPIWVAYHYRDPDDPDFNDCEQYCDLPTTWGTWMRMHSDKICAWQFGRIGAGEKYGVGSSNVDRDWVYFTPEKTTMNFTECSNLKLVSVTNNSPTCEVFESVDVNSGFDKLSAGESLPVTAIGEKRTIAGIEGTWYRVEHPNKEVAYVWQTPDRCRVEKKTTSHVEVVGEGPLADLLRALAIYLEGR